MLNFSDSKNKYFDYKIGLAGGLVMGIVVFFVNYLSVYDFMGSSTAAIKQGIYTFFFGGFIMKICELLAVRFNSKYISIALAIVIPTAISLVLTFGLHSLKGTPKPLASTIPTAFFIIPSTAVWANLKRKKSANSQ